MNDAATRPAARLESGADAPGTARYLNLDKDELERGKCLWTAREIAQQPRVWRAAHAGVDARREDIEAWLEPTLAHPRARILLCGAGTSAFIGESLAAWFRTCRRVFPTCEIAAAGTTDLTADPLQFLGRDLPTLMISFARSGDSPESVACVELADQLLSNCRHLIVTCNPAGRLARFADSRADVLCLMMPEEANDRGFAMTSSYTAMLVACLAVFTPDRPQLERAAAWAEKLLDGHAPEIAELARRDFNRLAVLGAGCLAGTAAEAALKCLELTGGKVVSVCDTPLGFRHGPKFVVDESTVIVHLRSSDAHMRMYDRDLARELRTDGRAAAILNLSPAEPASGIGAADAAARWDDIWLSLVYIVHCQLLAFHKALALGVEADNPSSTGEVNRVVNGVTIYPFADAADRGGETAAPPDLQVKQ